LEEKGVTIAAVQASKVEQARLSEWIEKSKFPFRVGMIAEDEEKSRFTWCVRSLPWLILTDADRVVRSQGFSIDELDEKISIHSRD
jgi:hypothetical protein